MTGPAQVLVVGADTAEVSALGDYVTTLLDGRCDLLAIEMDTTSVDPELAWGTEGPNVVRLTSDGATAASTAEEEPLAEDGDSWKAIVDAAERHHVDVIALVHRRQPWYSRLLSGSAARDVVAHADHPVLLVPQHALGTGDRAPRDGA